MNVAKHMALAMNPNLSADDFVRLVEEDADRTMRLLDQLGRHVAEVRREHGKQAGLRYLALCLPLVLCS